MIYADYNGSSPLVPAVREYLKRRMDTELFGNPNAIHSLGQKIFKRIEKSRDIISEALGCYPDQIIFNSGASEGISQIIRSILEQTQKEKNIILTGPLEHSIVANALSYYKEHHHFDVRYLEIDTHGRVLPEKLEQLLKDLDNKVALVTIMAANNETGVLESYQELASICSKYNVDFFSDTTQLIGKNIFKFDQSGLDYAVCSGHKIGALTGSGFIIAKWPTKLLPLVFGSHQEKGLRGGTQHYLGIETLAIAVSEFKENLQNLKKLNESKLTFEKEIRTAFPEAIIIGEAADRLSGTTLIGYPGIHGQAVQIELESNDIFVTTSAACTDNQPETSKVLKAMGIQDNVGRSVIRISLNYHQGEKDYSSIAEVLKAAYNKLHKIQSY
jgi:cysteine desulfurase